MAGSRRTKPRTIWLSKFSSLSSRSNQLPFEALHESFAQAALIGLHGLDAAAQVYRLCVTAAHVLVYLFLMGQAVGKHGIYVSEAQRFVRLNDRLRSRPTAKCIYYHFEQHPGVSYSIDPRGLLSERDSHGFDGWHGREMISHFVVIIARRYLGRNAGSPSPGCRRGRSASSGAAYGRLD